MKKSNFKAITQPYDKHQKPKNFTPRTLNSEKEYRRLKKLLTHKTDCIDRELNVSFSHPEKSFGWIDLQIKTETKTVIIKCSYAFGPFSSFIWWMEGIRWDRLQSPWEIEEEGRYKKLFVYPVDNIHLRLVVVADDNYALKHCIYKKEHIILDTVVRKEELIVQFYYGFKNFVNKDFKQRLWSDENLYDRLKQLDRTFDCNWDRWRGINPYA